MSQNEITRLFKYLMKFDEDLQELKSVAATKSDIDHILTVLDSQKDLLQTNEVERHALTMQVQQNSEHIEQLAKKVNLKLDYNA